MTDDTIDFVTGAPRPGSLDVRWDPGTPARRPATAPALQVHGYDEHTLILRQSLSVSHEAPFLYLLFGNRRALLLDTGASADPARFPLRRTVDGLIDAWLAHHPRADFGLVVAHSHAHADHVAADSQFLDRPATTVVPHELAAVRAFFGFGDTWPTGGAELDLGGRVLEVLASPGHHETAVTLYDPWSGLLLTGDTVLPGRLLAFDPDAYRATLDRLVSFAQDHPVTHVLGGHIEMTGHAGQDYPFGATYRPDERSLPMTPADLAAVRDATVGVAGGRGVHRFEDFILYLDPRKLDLVRLLGRGLVHRARALVARR